MKSYIVTRLQKISKNDVMQYLKDIDLGLLNKDYNLQQFFKDLKNYDESIKQKFLELEANHQKEIEDLKKEFLNEIQKLQQKIELNSKTILELNAKIESKGELLE